MSFDLVIWASGGIFDEDVELMDDVNDENREFGYLFLTIKLLPEIFPLRAIDERRRHTNMPCPLLESLELRDFVFEKTKSVRFLTEADQTWAWKNRDFCFDFDDLGLNFKSYSNYDRL